MPKETDEKQKAFAESERIRLEIATRNFSKALENKDYALMEKYLSEGADVNATIEIEDVSSVAKYAKEGNLEGVKFLLDHGANPSGLSFYKSALYFAVKRKDSEMVNLLLDHGGKSNNEPVVAMAAENDDLKMLNSLLEHGENPNLWLPKSEGTYEDYTACYPPLAFAMKNRNKKMIESLSSHNADFDQKVEVYHWYSRRKATSYSLVKCAGNDLSDDFVCYVKRKKREQMLEKLTKRENTLLSNMNPNDLKVYLCEVYRANWNFHSDFHDFKDHINNLGKDVQERRGKMAGVLRILRKKFGSHSAIQMAKTLRQGEIPDEFARKKRKDLRTEMGSIYKNIAILKHKEEIFNKKLSEFPNERD